MIPLNSQYISYQKIIGMVIRISDYLPMRSAVHVQSGYALVMFSIQWSSKGKLFSGRFGICKWISPQTLMRLRNMQLLILLKTSKSQYNLS